MKKRYLKTTISLLLLVALVATAFVGCGGKE